MADSALKKLFIQLELAQIPALDRTLTVAQQSILFEIGFWCFAYAIFANICSRLIRVIYSKCSFWEQCKKRSGIFAQNAQDDCIVLSILALHHGFGGTLMLLGSFYGDSMLWRHGYLVETGFEVYDLIAMVFYMFPYTEYLKPEIRVVMAFHHIPGICLSMIILTSDLGKNHHLHMIGGCLLFAGGVSCAAGLYVHSLDFKKQMWQAIIGQIVNALFYIAARFIVYPIEVYGIYNDMVQGGYSDFEVKSVAVGTLMMGVFNVVLLPDILSKCYRYTVKAINNDTAPLEKDVPLSKEDRMRKEKSA
mmetsp:Transcript_4229/g.4959  ORF Transcript_4229/g.4959 Transcript_4229/m.4959 type:complete len:305 (-) Transcript_4229:102-1016(-)|eukprot:CAMPEP_0204827546 /NCGR_PEP_ID=MMETSP1346-20131115/4983_1 /ASSEMBLY_ACC=CAM_ASM_000771 /TAXON_ID=215587 /ORGANISM="Aplanochytrium stocchinoi, Strain GSBS06" /LENGTH=304 /DNA_ID=CAMNT_0051956017 /DNA_START=738 /DNA_END=1652 /DNA_ORIENTATION=-